MARHGQIHVYGGSADPHIINNPGYKVKVVKTWVQATEVWHVQFISEGDIFNRYELFLTDSELEHLRRIL